MWLAWYRLFPYDEGAAEIAATLCNIHRDPKKRRKPFTRADFLRGLQPAEEPDAGETLFANLRSLQTNG